MPERTITLDNTTHLSGDARNSEAVTQRLEKQASGNHSAKPALTTLSYCERGSVLTKQTAACMRSATAAPTAATTHPAHPTASK